MQSQLHPYLSFRDNARQAMEFYQSVFGGELTIDTFEAYHASEDPAEANKVMHAMLKAGSGITFMASDTPNFMPFEEGARISLSLSGENEAELRGYFEKLSAGGSIVMPLEQAPWGALYGMCTDRFGVGWMVNITAPPSGA